jgi:hypothetical protein
MSGEPSPKTHIITVPRFEFKHILYMILCLAGAAAALYFFWRDLNLTLEGFQDKPLGTVTRKQNIAQRRFTDRTLWDRLRRQSSVYSGNYIRTAELSGAVLSLSGGELVELGEHTLIQLLQTAEGLTVELAEGELEADTGNSGLHLRAAGASLRAEPGSVLRAAAGEGGFEAGLTAGSAVFAEGGETTALMSGDTVNLSPAARRAAVLSPPPGAGFLNTSGGAQAITFVWKRIGLDSNQALRLEIAEDRAFTAGLRRYDSFASAHTVELENGRYYWRVYPAEQSSIEGGVSGRMSVINAPPPDLISPAPDEEFRFRTLRPGLRFLWTSREGAESYSIAISSRPDMAGPLYQSQVQDSGGEVSSIVFSGFETGTWYWQIRSEYPRSYEGSPGASRIGSFRIGRVEALNVPVQQVPLQEASLYLEDKKEEAYFSWKQEKDAASYTFLLSQSEDLSDPLIRQKVQDNYYVYDLKSGNLAPGQYYWGVYQTDSAGNDSAPSAVRNIFIMAGAPPEIPAPPVPPAEEYLVSAATAPPEAPARPAAPQPAPRPPAPPAAGPAVPKPEAPPPPLPAPANLRPARAYTLTEETIVRDRQLAFSWNAVPGASSYVFILYQAENGGRREILRRSQNETRFTLTDLAVLDAGSFIWRVEPVSRLAGQKSEAGESSFTVIIAETQASQGQEAGVLFGTE